MNSLTEVTLTQFQSALTAQNIRVFQIIHGTIALGVAAFMGVVFFLYSTQGATGDSRDLKDAYDLIKVLTLAHIMLAAGVYTVARVIFNMLLGPSALQGGMIKEIKDTQGRIITNNGEKILAMMRTALIVRLAMLEAPALFGLVICLIAVTNGTIYQTSLIWLNAVTALILIGFVILTFPSKEKLEEIFNSRIAGTPM